MSGYKTPLPLGLILGERELALVLPVSITIPTSQIDAVFAFERGSTTLVAGANGVGKSALLYDVFRRLPAQAASYYPGHRQITFNNGWDNLQQDMIQLSQYFHSHTENFNRYKSSWAEDHFKMVVKKLQNMESKYRGDLFERFREGAADALEEARRQASPLGRLNAVFASAGLAVRLSVDENGLLVKRGSDVYRVDQMSDGERAALFLVGAIITQAADTVILIDEPERHLHPSISGPLLEVASRIRSDLAYVFSTHDLTVLEHLASARVIHVLDSTIVSLSPESRKYEVAVIDQESGVPEEIKLDLLGSRKRILFVEGENTSLDRQLYAHLYPGWKVTPKGGWDKCVGAVKHFRDNGKLHWIQTAAIVDGDGRTPDEVAAWAKEDIHALPCPTIENLFLLEDVLSATAEALNNLKGEASPASRMDEVKRELPAILRRNLDAIVDRRTVWRVNRSLERAKVSVADVRDGTAKFEVMDVQTSRAETLREISEIIDGMPPLEALQVLPIKNTGVPKAIADLLGAGKFEDLQRIVLRQIEMDSREGRAITASMRSVLPKPGSS